MQCFHPVTGYQNHPGAQLSFKDQGGTPIEVRCGQCIGCRVTKARSWALRCVHEATQHKTSSFITLTYDEANLPENGSLDFKDWSLFMHRLRKHCARQHDQKIRFYAAGEYGNDPKALHRIGRPHFHAIIFGHDFAADRVLKEDRNDQNKSYHSDTLEQIWGKGRTDIGLVTLQSAAYVAQYTVKKITGQNADDHYQRFNPITGEVNKIQPEQSRQSRNPGIGKGWLDSYGPDLDKGFVTLEGKREAIPQFYQRFMDADKLEQIKEDQKKGLPKVTREALAAQEKHYLQVTQDINR